MEINITSGRGTAPTALASFDSALAQAGIANFNLIYLSSIIPAGSRIADEREFQIQDAEWGDRLYVVMAQQRETEIGKEAWAGIGWVQEPDSGRGLFVEHHGNSQHFVEAQVEESLMWMMKSRPDGWGEVRMRVIGITCESNPVCALAAAVYLAEPWISEASIG